MSIPQCVLHKNRATLMLNTTVSAHQLEISTYLATLKALTAATLNTGMRNITTFRSTMDCVYDGDLIRL